ncbi:MAG: amino acid ABC transporter substrate-binding protein [Desulfomicrobium sp.]|nr:amino acid ABC transporter substrate-binding protein [Desulfomicrobium sp.]
MKQILLASLCFFVLAQTAVADDSWSKVQARGEVVVGFAAHYPPFESKNEKTGEFEGFDVDLAKAMAEVLGVKVKFVDAEWQGLLGGLNKGDFDMLVTCMSKSETRGQNVNFSDSYYSLADVMVVARDNQDIKTVSDLQGRIVGVQLGSGSEQAVDAMTGFKEVKRYNYNPEAFLDLKNGRIDALVVGYAYAVNQIKEDSSYKVVGTPLAEAEIVVVMPKGADALTAQINEALAATRKNGAYDKAYATWLKLD